jgi:hypothetical protein
VDFGVPCSGNSGRLLDQASRNEAHEKCFHIMCFVIAVMFHGPNFMGVSQT